MTRRRTLLLTAAAALFTASGCTTPAPAPSPTPPSTVPFRTPTTGDWQEGPPTGATPTSAPPAATTTPPTATGSTLPPGRAGVPRGQQTPDAKVDRTDASAVAAAFAARLAEVDTRLDNRPHDASRRAAHFATTDLRAALTDSQAPVGGVGAAFLELQAHDGYTVVTTKLGGLGTRPPDTTTTATRAVTTTATGRNDAGWRSRTVATQTWLISLTRTKHGWAVDDYRIG